MRVTFVGLGSDVVADLPNRWIREFLALTGLADQVRILENTIESGAGQQTTLARPA